MAIVIDCSVTHWYYLGMNTKENLPKDNTVIADADIAVIGGGVVGCAAARKMTLEGASVVLLEKAPDILDGASKGNSAILHTGFDAPPDTLEQSCVAAGYREYLKIRKDLNLPIVETGALLSAWTSEEESKFQAIIQKAEKNGVMDLSLLTRDQILSREPYLSSKVRCAISVPGESIIDPWSAPLAYLTQAVTNGAKAFFNAGVTGGSFDGEAWTLTTPRGQVRARYVVNCAGLYGDLVNQNVLGETDFTIKPRKGQFVVFDKAASPLLTSIILPVPTARTKGIVIFPTIFGNLVVGPTAEEQESRSKADVDRDILISLKDRAIQKIPELAGIPVTATYAGIRPATEQAPYRVSQDPARHWITLGGIRSTGLTSALGLANHLATLFSDMGLAPNPIDNPDWPKVPNLAQSRPRDHATPGYGQMACHCEMVTEREILAAMNSPVPAKSMDGLKRRTRATMGRCQGFYCSCSLAKLTEGKFDNPLAIGGADD